MFATRTLAGVLLAGAVATGGTVAVDRHIDPYEDKSTHYELALKSDIPQGERVEIHKDKAQMDLIGWNDEYKISIIPQIPSALLGASERPFTVEADRPLLSKRMEYKSGDVTAFIEPKEGTENEFDIDFTLDSKPDTNVFTYKIEGAEEFDFNYQSEEFCFSEGVICPENVVGSYAVYHKTKANHRVGFTNYGTGKVFHIYRPKAIDANGMEVWAELKYISGVLSVAVSQKFLDEAVYPVIVDPTIGVLICGASDTSSANIWRGEKALASENGDVASVSACVADNNPGGTTDTFKGVLVASSTMNILSNGVTIASADTDTNLVANVWATTTFSVSPSITASTDYFVGVVGNGTDWLVAFDSVAANGSHARDITNSYATPTNPTDADVLRTTRHSIYATYTADEGGVTAPVLNHDDIIWWQ